MPLEQTITIVNNSGKIISNGKQLFSIFKDAQNSYLEKKAEIKGISRAQTFDQTRSLHRNQHPRSSSPARPQVPFDYDQFHQLGSSEAGGSQAPRRSFDDNISETNSRRSYHTSRSVRSQHYSYGDAAIPRSRPPLTSHNLKTHSEVSSITPSRAPPNAYKSPYAETAGRDMQVSRMTLPYTDVQSVAVTERLPPGHMVSRRRSESEMGGQQALMVTPTKPKKEIDMDLAYGSCPPDLEQMVHLDPNFSDGDKAKQLVTRVEGLLTEADCLKSSAGAIIKRLQEDPNAAASVALTLTELSKVVGKMSPAFLGILKGSSPAVFGLLASPQFLIGTSVLAGVTVVMFGGWKIVQKVKANQAPREILGYPEGTPGDRPAPLRVQTEPTGGMDEALILDDELSTIESWRRGITPFGDDASADVELITPEADRSHKERHGGDDFDTQSRRSTRTSRTAKSHKSSSSRSMRDKDVPERKSSRRATESVVSASSERSSSSRKKHSSSSSTVSSKERKRREAKDGEDEGKELVVRSRLAQRQGSNMLKAIFKPKGRDLVLA